MRKKMIAVSVSLMFACSALLLMVGCQTTVKPPPVGKDAGPAHTGATADSEAAKMARIDDLSGTSGTRGVSGPEEAINSYRIYFDYDRSELNAEAQSTIKKIAGVLQSNPSYSLDVSGHCDERGTIEYNLALGERRARAAKKFLITLGISGDRISTISYGEERPVDPQSSESAWAKNRRNEFMLIK